MSRLLRDASVPVPAAPAFRSLSAASLGRFVIMGAVDRIFGRVIHTLGLWTCSFTIAFLIILFVVAMLRRHAAARCSRKRRCVDAYLVGDNSRASCSRFLNDRHGKCLTF